MRIKTSVKWCTTAMLGLCSVGIGQASGHEATEQESSSKVSKPNILFLIMDDMRPELGCYGADYIVSPAIDSLSKEGIQFNQAYSNIPVSGASRASLFTGLRPGKTRFWDVHARIDKEAPDVFTMPEWFREHGYTTISNSKVIHGKSDMAKRSWDELWHAKTTSETWRDYLGDENISVERKRGGPSVCEALDVDDDAYIDGKTVTKSIQDLKQLKQAGKPFFLAVGILKPHLPFNAPKKYWDLYDRSTIQLPASYDADFSKFPKVAFHAWNEMRFYNQVPQKGDVSPEVGKELIHGYRACMSYADAQVGRITSALKRLKLDDNTIVVLVGDHGWSLGDHRQWCKHSNFNIVNRVPFIIKYPGMPRHEIENQIVELVDIYPTLCNLANIPIPKHTQGESIVPLMEQTKGSTWKNCAIVKWHNGLTIFNQKYAYTMWENKQGKCTDEMLFDYNLDKDELVNRAKDPAYQSIKEKLHKEILARRGSDFNNH